MGNYNNRNQNQNNQNQVKKSGATYSRIKKKGKFEGGTIVNAWNFSRSKGLITATVAPYSKSKEFTGEENGNTYQTMMARVYFERSGVEHLIPCCMNLETRVISLDTIKMCITPNGSGYTSSGKKVTGYFGKYLKR